MDEDKIINMLIKLTNKASKHMEIPVAAIVVKKNKILSYAFNLKENKKCALYHAELLAIKRASRKNNDWRLNDCVIYTTLFPCPMCSSAIDQSRIREIKYIYDTKNIEDYNISRDILKNVKITKLDYNINYIDVFFNKIRK